MGFKYSPEQIEYMLSLRGLSGVEMAARFNAKFNMNKSWDALLSTAKNHDPTFRLSKDYYSQEEDSWLIANRPFYIIPELTKEYNRIFGKKRTVNAIGARCERLGVYSNLDLKSRKGYKIWHDGMSEDERKSHYTEESWNRSRFKPGVAVNKRYRVGDEVVKGNGKRNKKYIYVKISEDPTISPDKQWMPKQRYIWEQTYGLIPEGYAIIFLDGDYKNCNLNNLACVPNGYLGAMNSRKWMTDDPELNMLTIKYYELTSSITNKRQEMNGR